MNYPLTEKGKELIEKCSIQYESVVKYGEEWIALPPLVIVDKKRNPIENPLRRLKGIGTTPEEAIEDLFSQLEKDSRFFQSIEDYKIAFN